MCSNQWPFRYFCVLFGLASVLTSTLQRKNGLFKKAYELGVLCSVDVAVIIFGGSQRAAHTVQVVPALTMVYFYTRGASWPSP